MAFLVQAESMSKDLTQADMIGILKMLTSKASQRQVAKHFGISAAYINDIINGRRDVSEAVAAKLGYTRKVLYEVTHVKAKPARL